MVFSWNFSAGRKDYFCCFLIFISLSFFMSPWTVCYVMVSGMKMDIFWTFWNHYKANFKALNHLIIKLLAMVLSWNFSAGRKDYFCYFLYLFLYRFFYEPLNCLLCDGVWYKNGYFINILKSLQSRLKLEIILNHDLISHDWYFKKPFFWTPNFGIQS